MELIEAKKYIHCDVEIEWTCRTGDRKRQVVYILDARVMQRYGPCFVTNIGEIALERITDIAESLPRAA